MFGDAKQFHVKHLNLHHVSRNLFHVKHFEEEDEKPKPSVARR